MLRWRSAGSLPELAEVFVSTKRTSSNKPSTCGYGTGTDLVLRITAYPVQLAGLLEGKQVHVARVALYECQTCGHLMPTPAGQAKVDRNVAMAIRFFLGQLH